MSTKLRRTAAKLVERIGQAQAGVQALAQPQLGSSSIEQGVIEEYDADGTLVSATGGQFDGTHTAVSLAGPQPPMPSQPSMTPGPGRVEIRWNGKWDDEDAVSPMDFSHVSVHMSLEEAFDPDNDTQVATIRGESGDSVMVDRETGEWWVSLVAVSQSGKWSDPTEPVLVEVPDMVTIEVFQDARIEIDDQIEDVRVSADGKTRIFASTHAPTNEAAMEGDRWEVYTDLGPGGRLLQTWRYGADGTWQLYGLDATYIPLLDIGTGTYGELSGSRLIAGSVKADALEAVLVLVTNLIAGDPNGTHARMGPDGFTVWASPDGVSAPVVVVRMGVGATDDYFSLMRADSTIAASISAAGDIAGTSLSTEKIALGGLDLRTDILDQMGGRLVAWASRGTNSPYWAGTTKQPYLQLDADVVPGRAYLVQTTPISIDSDTGNVEAQVFLHYKEGGAACQTTDQVIAGGISVQGSASTRRTPVTINRLITPSTNSVSLLLSYGTVSSGRSKIIAATAGNAVVMTLIDIGPASAEVGVDRNGTSDAATGGTGGGSDSGTVVKKNYVKTYAATGTRSYDGSGNPYNYNTSYMYQGLSPAGYGNLKSMAVFPNWTLDLAGSTVTKVEVYVYADFWYYSAGGKMQIGVNSASALPATLGAPGTINTVATVPGWPRASGRWVTLPSSWNNSFKTGGVRSITLGQIVNAATYEEYGYAHGMQVRISYTK